MRFGLFAPYHCFTLAYMGDILKSQNGCDHIVRYCKNITKLRKLSGMTQDELAEKLFVTRQTVSGWENGRTQPNLDILSDLAVALGCSPLDIIGNKRSKMSRELFVAMIYENEGVFYENAFGILNSDYLCEIAIKNTILVAFEKMDEFDVGSFCEQFDDMLEEECNKILNDKLIKRSECNDE